MVTVIVFHIVMTTITVFYFLNWYCTLIPLCFLVLWEKLENFFPFQQFTRCLCPSLNFPSFRNAECPELTRWYLYIDKVSWVSGPSLRDPALMRTCWSPALRPVTKAFGSDLIPIWKARFQFYLITKGWVSAFQQSCLDQSKARDTWLQLSCQRTSEG